MNNDNINWKEIEKYIKEGRTGWIQEQSKIQLQQICNNFKLEVNTDETINEIRNKLRTFFKAVYEKEEKKKLLNTTQENQSRNFNLNPFKKSSKINRSPQNNTILSSNTGAIPKTKKPTFNDSVKGRLSFSPQTINPTGKCSTLNDSDNTFDFDNTLDYKEEQYTEIEGILNQQSLVTYNNEHLLIDIENNISNNLERNISLDNLENNTYNMATLKLPLKEVAKLVPDFDGTNISTAEYISKLKQAKTVIAAEDEASLTNFLKIKLKGEPYNALNNTGINNIDGLIKAIRRLYPIVDDVHVLYGKLSQIFQQIDESVIHYTNRLKDLVLEIKELKKDENLSEQEMAIFEKNINNKALTYFKEGLKFEIRVQLGSQNTLQDASLEAIKIESKIKKINSQYDNFQNNQTNQIIKENKKINLCQICRDFRHEALFCDIAACVYCKKSDHCSNSCNNVINKIQLICRCCSQSGHSIDTCNFNRNQGIYCQYCQEINHEVNRCPFIKEYEQCWKCKESGHNPNMCPKKPFNSTVKQILTTKICKTDEFCSMCQEQGHEATDCDQLKLLVTQFKEKNNLKCQLCDTTGHTAKDCFKFRKPRNENFNKNSNESARRNTGTNFTQKKVCTYCKAPGHIMEHCYRLKYLQNLAKNNSNNKTCFFCKKQGHSMDECRTLKSLESSTPKTYESSSDINQDKRMHLQHSYPENE